MNVNNVQINAAIFLSIHENKFYYSVFFANVNFRIFLYCAPFIPGMQLKLALPIWLVFMYLILRMPIIYFDIEALMF